MLRKLSMIVGRASLVRDDDKYEVTTTHGLPPARTFSPGIARLQKADPRAGPFLRAGLLQRHLRDVRLRADEPDRRVRRVPAALPPLALRHGVRAAAQAALLRAGPNL